MIIHNKIIFFCSFIKIMSRNKSCLKIPNCNLITFTENLLKEFRSCISAKIIQTRASSEIFKIAFFILNFGIIIVLKMIMKHSRKGNDDNMQPVCNRVASLVNEFIKLLTVQKFRCELNFCFECYIHCSHFASLLVYSITIINTVSDHMYIVNR